MYLIINNETFGFDDKPDNNDIEVTNEDFDKFFTLQSQGKQFRQKTISTGTGLFDYIEEFVAEVIGVPKTEVEILKEQIASLTEIVDTLVVSNLA